MQLEIDQAAGERDRVGRSSLARPEVQVADAFGDVAQAAAVGVVDVPHRALDSAERILRQGNHRSGVTVRQQVVNGVEHEVHAARPYVSATPVDVVVDEHRFVDPPEPSIEIDGPCAGVGLEEELLAQRPVDVDLLGNQGDESFR